MSTEDIFEALVEEKKEEKPAQEETTEKSKEPESEAEPIPEEESKTDDKVEEEAPAQSKAEDVDDWFAPAVDEPAMDKPAVEESTEDKPTEDQPVEGEVAGEPSAEEIPEAETPVEVVDDWFTPASKEQVPAEIPAEVSVDKGTLISIEASPIVAPAISPEAMREQMKTFQSLKASLLDKSTDIAQIQGKPFVKRSGWRKFALVFNVSDDIVKSEKEIFGDDFEWRFWVKATAPNGRSVIGIGSCCSDEREFTHRRHDVLAVAHTRAKNRALSDLIGSGEVSWEELRGMA